MWSVYVLLSLFGITRSFTTSIDVSGVVNGNRMAGVPLGISLGTGELDVEGICTQSGMACQNCTLAVTCIPLPGGWLKVPLEECSSGLTCNAHKGLCSKDPVPECDVTTRQYKHTCEQVGIFPDAHDCRKFHLCSPPDGLPDGRPADHRTALCPRHYGYDPKTAQCSIKLNNGQCDKTPVPKCSKVGEMAVLPSSPNHYYVCLSRHGKLHPQIFICPHGWYFYEGFCHPEKKGIEDAMISRRPEETTTEKITTAKPTTKPQPTHSTMNRLESFFSTEKATTYAADTFLADRFDLSNYESTDDVAPSGGDDFVNSFENNDFW